MAVPCPTKAADEITDRSCRYRSMTGYTQDTATVPGYHGFPFRHVSG
jgi:hypothetical protein